MDKESMNERYKEKTDYLIKRKRLSLSSHILVLQGLKKHELAQKQLANFDEDLDSYRAEIEDLPTTEIAVHYAREQEVEALDRERPNVHDADKPFYTREARANFDYWCKAAYWSLHEATALSLGREPTAISPSQIEGLTKISSFAKRYVQRYDLLVRAYRVDLLTPEPTPSEFLEWADKSQLKIDTELRAQLALNGITSKDWKAEYEALKENFSQPRDAETDEAIESRERTSFLKLIYGLAISNYDYDPEAKTNHATGKKKGSIASDLQALGFELQPDTIRKFLKEAYALFGKPGS